MCSLIFYIDTQNIMYLYILLHNILCMSIHKLLCMRKYTRGEKYEHKKIKGFKRR